MKINDLKPIFKEKKHLVWWVYGLATVGFSIQKYGLGRGTNGYTTYENYLIFKNSFSHLLDGLNIYASFPAEQWDLFKYSPAFAVGMMPFSALPDCLGLPIWNLLNALVLLSAILNLPMRNTQILAWLILPELTISLQNSQSNGLLAGLMIWVFIFLEKGKFGRAGVFAAAGGFIKIFGIFAAVFWLFFWKEFLGNKKSWRFFTAFILSSLIFTVLPLVFLSFENFAKIYKNWFQMLANDHSTSLGFSVMGLLKTWFGLEIRKLWVLLAGLAVLGFSFLAVWHRRSENWVRLNVLASVLIWVVIFNHKAESPTFIIAFCGVGIWFLTGKKTYWEKILLALAFILASLSPTDIFPRNIRETIVEPYVLKTLPFILIWFSISYQLFAAGVSSRQKLKTTDGVSEK